MFNDKEYDGLPACISQSSLCIICCDIGRYHNHHSN